ncbi:MAG: glycosyltransferase [Planctomycetota bacterium]
MQMTSSGPIAYISQFYPHLTETFVYREVLALRRRGLKVLTFGTWSPDRTKLSAEALPLVDETVYVFPLVWRRYLGNHLCYLFRRPRRYLSTLCFVLTRRRQSWRNRGFSFLHFCMAVHLARPMQRRGVSHIHAHFAINAATIALVISRLLDVPFSFTAHNLLFTKQMILLEKCREARFIVAISEYTRRFLIDYAKPYDVAPKIHVVHCGLSPAEFSSPSDLPRKDLPEILFVAQLQERKGAPVLVEACGILARRGVRFRCVIVGDGPERARVEEAVRRHSLEEVVSLEGAVPQERVRAYFDHADLFVLPCVTAQSGDVDGVPVSLMEAMAKKIAVVSTRVSGIPELVEHGESGLLVEEGEPGPLADAISRLLADDALRRRMGEAGRRKVEAEFDVEASACRLSDLFRQSLRSAAGR